ncbi:hemagglutinin/hemolysin-like protein [Leifsonia xyli subsp. cynodontis DSM 46306]|uniref:Big-1 domain-containing protein n=1 Tax=Leifsonia xyli subsp. cynodontis DSM 46306 TaxID=1389489 RepID=U3PCI0_LEIXC|nr:hemagglutinin/hemolysin-like protein [Leifsonia xyli subsp. cynodontis DSM 46306]
MVELSVEAGAALSAQTIVTDADGTGSVRVSSTTPGSFAVHARIDGVDIGGSPAPAVFVGGDPDPTLSTLSVTVGDRIADGVETHTLTARIRDADGHTVEGATVRFGLADGLTSSGQEVVTSAQGEATTTVTTRTAGVYPVSATVDGSEIGDSPSSVAFVAGATNPSDSTLTTTTGAVLADGVAQHIATATVKDATGNPVSGVSVDFIVDPGATASAGSAVTSATGIAEITITSTNAAMFGVRASIDGTELSGSPRQVQFSAEAVDADNSYWTVTPSGPVTADRSDAYTAKVVARDSVGNPVANTPISFTSDEPVSVSSPTCQTDDTGSCEVTFTSATAGSYAAGAFIGGTRIGVSQTLVFEAGPASTATSTIEASPAEIPANGTAESTIVVRLLDADGNPLQGNGGTVVIATDAGSIGATKARGDGTYTATLTGAAEGTATLSFTLDGRRAEATAQVVFSDATAPIAPVVDPSNGSTITGTAEPGSTIRVHGDDGAIIGTGTACVSQGRWSIC